MKVNILISNMSLPSTKIGSWNLMFTRLLKHKPRLFTHIIAPASKEALNEVQYFPVKPVKIKSYKLQSLLGNYRFKNYLKPLKTILKTCDFATINVIDNKNLAVALDEYLKSSGLRKKVKIIYHLHGYDIVYGNMQKFYNAVDTLIVITKSSYQYQLDKHHALPCKVRQLYNGVDTNLFKPVDSSIQTVIKERLGFSNDKTYYLWLSQDRKKKGLHVVLEAWQKFIENKPNVELLVIGTKDYGDLNQVSFFGRIPNHQLSQYYQIATFFIFSTLCHEGQGLALTEALKSGCYCLASNIDPISEVLENGNYGVLVDNPNHPLSWVETLERTLTDYKNNGNSFKIPSERYDFDVWMDAMESIIFDEHQTPKVL